MKKFVVLIFCLLTSLSTSYSQTTNENKLTSKDYSESVPYKPTEFPDDISKKVKKSKANSNKEKNNIASTKESSLSIPVTVVDKQGKVVTDLKKSDFQIFADDQEIKDFSIEDKVESLNIILLLDTSPSTDYKIKDLQNYALKIVENLNPQDKVMVAEFYANLKIRTELTNDRKIINKAIKKTNFGDGTSLYDAIQQIFEKNIKISEERTALILITDGVDTTSIKSNYAKSLERVEQSNIPVFVGYIDSFEQNRKSQSNLNNILFQSTIGNLGRQSVESIKIDYETGKHYLNDLISLSGGRSSLFENVTDPKFAQELRLKYYLKFTPSETDKTGERKQIKVRVNRPNLFLLAKGSYIAN